MAVYIGQQAHFDMQASSEEPLGLVPFLESKREAVNLFLDDVMIKVLVIYGINYDAKVKRYRNPIYFN